MSAFPSSGFEQSPVFERANDTVTSDNLAQGNILDGSLNQAIWKSTQDQMQSTDLSKLGFSNFEIEGINQTKESGIAAGASATAPESMPPYTDSGEKDHTGAPAEQAGAGDNQPQLAGGADLGGQKAGGDAQATSPNESLAHNDTSEEAASHSQAGTADASFGPNGREIALNSDGKSGIYTVQPGDSLWAIAQDTLTPPGETLSLAQQSAMAPEIMQMVDQIAADNQIADPSEIQSGQQLTINGLNRADFAAAVPISADGGATTSSAVGAGAVDASVAEPNLANPSVVNPGAVNPGELPNDQESTPADDAGAAMTTTASPSESTADPSIWNDIGKFLEIGLQDFQKAGGCLKLDIKL